jgi:hypothetical protein
MDRDNAIIIKIESGVVADIYSTGPLRAIIVDYDMIEGGETFERRMKKAVINQEPAHRVMREHMDALVKTLVLQCQRPADRTPNPSAADAVDAAA